MKKNFICFTIIASLILFSSCQKEVDGDPDVVVTDKVKTYTEEVISDDLGNFTVTFNLSYDANDRITAMTSSTDPGSKFAFTYKTGSYSMDLYDSGVWEIHEDYFLNGNSLVDSAFQYNNTEDTSTTKYVYNGNSQLVKMYQYEYSHVTGPELWNIINYTYDAGGNLVSTLDTYNYAETYEYYPDLVYAMPAITPFANLRKQRLLKKYTLSINGSPVGSASYTYTFDNKNRLSTQRAEDTDGNIVTKTFTYF